MMYKYRCENKQKQLPRSAKLFCVVGKEFCSNVEDINRNDTLYSDIMETLKKFIEGVKSKVLF